MTDDSDPPEHPKWRGWVFNRFTLTAAVLAAITIGWNLYVSMHDDGRIAGQVVDAQGQPVAGAQVSLWVYNFTTFQEAMHVTSGADGDFLITGNPSHRIQLTAQKPGLGASERIPIRLYFRSQNLTLAAPLVLPGT